MCEFASKKGHFISKLFGLKSKLLAFLMKNNFPKRLSIAPIKACQNCMTRFLFFNLPLLNKCIALFAAVAGWLLLDIG